MEYYRFVLLSDFFYVTTLLWVASLQRAASMTPAAPCLPGLTLALPNCAGAAHSDAVLQRAAEASSHLAQPPASASQTPAEVAADMLLAEETALRCQLECEALAALADLLWALASGMPGASAAVEDASHQATQGILHFLWGQLGTGHAIATDKLNMALPVFL